MIVNNTPISLMYEDDIPIYIKHEELCTQTPGPPFSKCRGLYAHLLKLKESGITTVGYSESAISMAGWGVAWMAKKLQMNAVIFDPQYKQTPAILKIHRRMWSKFNPTIVEVKAGRTAVNYYYGRSWLQATYGDKAVMLPIGLRLEETIEETAKEWERTYQTIDEAPKTVVICVGSGTICAGLLRGMKNHNMKLIGVMAYGTHSLKKKRVIERKAGVMPQGLLSKVAFDVYPTEYQYREYAKCECPFPCHPNYDLKTWEWLMANKRKLRKPILFWNIGGTYGLLRTEGADSESHTEEKSDNSETSEG